MKHTQHWTTNAGPTGVKQLTELSGGVDASGRFVVYAIAGRSYFDPEGEISGIFFTGCQKWDDHNAITDVALKKNLSEQIKENADLSKFAELLEKEYASFVPPPGY